MSSSNFTESGKLIKMEVDYSATVDDKIPIAESMAKAGKFGEALEMLLSLEKQARTGADTHSTSRILICIVNLCVDAKKWDELNDTIVLLTKRRSQIKQAITKMIQECCKFVDLTPSKETKLKLIDTLRTVTAGKIYVEVERARLTHKLAQIREADGQLADAANIMIELQVETFGSMDKREKVELILEQMRLCLARNDFVRTQIMSRKIHTKFFADEKMSDLKLKYYELMIQLNQHDSSYLNICKHYQAVFTTPSISEQPEQKKDILKHIVLYIILAPFDNEHSDLIHRIEKEKMLEDMPKYRELIKLFTNEELINWESDVIAKSENLLRNGTTDLPATGVFDTSEAGKKRWEHLRERVVEHNIRVIAKYYKRLSLSRMAHLLCLTEDETELVLSKLVVNKSIWAKMDRLEGIVSFAAHKDPNEVLNDWSFNINSLMEHICEINHLINKEQMIHQHLHVSKSVAAPIDN